jgi:hypothetical protein
MPELLAVKKIDVLKKGKIMNDQKECGYKMERRLWQM